MARTRRAKTGRAQALAGRVEALSSPTPPRPARRPETEAMSGGHQAAPREISSALATRRASGALPRSNMTTLSVKLVLLLVTAPSWKPSRLDLVAVGGRRARAPRSRSAPSTSISLGLHRSGRLAAALAACRRRRRRSRCERRRRPPPPPGRGRRRRSRPGSAARPAGRRDRRGARAAARRGSARAGPPRGAAAALLAQRSRRLALRWRALSSSSRSSSARSAAAAEVASLRSASRSGADPGPLAQAADVARLGEVEQGEDGEAEERRQAGEGADVLDQLHRDVAARGYSS